MFKRKKEGLKCSAVIVAAGSSTRMGVDKIMLDLHYAPVIAWTLTAFERCEDVTEIVLVTQEGKIPELLKVCKDYNIRKVRHYVNGGATRTESVLKGVEMCADDCELIAVHDGARPLLETDLITRTVKAASEHGAAVPVVKVKDTIRQALCDKLVKSLDRDTTYLMQTPQVFKKELLLPALVEALRLGLTLTDDCEAVMLQDVVVHTVEGSEQNIKITTPFDIALAQTVIEWRGEHI